jgi:hypothetical protein
MIDQGHDGRFSGGTDFFGMVCSLSIGCSSMLVGRLSWDDLDRDLSTVVSLPLGIFMRSRSPYLFTSLLISGQLDLAHASCTNRLS